MATDPAFRRSVASGVRSILVDEFQDVTDRVYAVIRHLYLGSDSRAGVMVIGDDDQDILRWQRKRNDAHQFSEEYFKRFENDFGRENVGRFVLGVNFRSDKAIVGWSQSLIARFFSRTTRSQRLKSSNLTSRKAALEGSCVGKDWRKLTWNQAISETETLLGQLVVREGDTTAILCRSNAEVAEAHHQLSQVFPGLSVQGAANLRVADLRHVGLWLDYLREVVRQNDRALSEGLKHEIFDEFAGSGRTTEFVRSESTEIRLDDLWALCCQDQAFPHLSSLIRFVEELRTDDLGRLSGLMYANSTVVVSTLHKVKGLEFDNVIILPSVLPFGIGSDDLAGDAAEEMRLFYVGMTRAKRHLFYFFGDREHSWWKRDAELHCGLNANGLVLEGSMEDVSLSWAMKKTHFNADPDQCQNYIETEVAVGDPIELGGAGGGAFKALMHRSGAGGLVQIGFLAMKHVSGGRDASLKVSAVVRFRPDPLDDDSLAACVRARGWGYVVLVSGRLR